MVNNRTGDVPYGIVGGAENPAGATAASSARSWTSKLQSGPVIALFVLGSLVLIVGAVYAYIYFTRINPRSARARKYSEQSAAQDGDAGNQGAGTHLFLFRRA